MAAKAKQAVVDADDDDEAPAAGPAKRKLPLKLVVVVAAGLVVLAAGGATAYFAFGGKKETQTAAPAPKPVVFIDLPDVLVNLANPAGERAQYLKVKIVLEVADQALVAQIQPVMPRVMDAFQTYLRELRPNDLDGSAGLYRLREELTRRVNAAIEPAHINAVLFKELVIQ